jgi:hypothetical protein
MDYDVQLIGMISKTKMKKKLMSFLILLISVGLNIVTFWSYMIALSISLNDPNNFIYPLFMKLNFMEIKKSRKAKKKNKVHELLFNGK